MSSASLVEWMIALPGGTPGPNGVRVRLEPTANIRSAFAMNSVNIFGRERVEAPSASGGLSGGGPAPPRGVGLGVRSFGGLGGPPRRGNRRGERREPVARLRIQYALPGP